MQKMSTHVLSTLRKHNIGSQSFVECYGSRCWRPPVTGRQVTIFLLRSVCRVGGFKSQPLTVGIGLRQGRGLSPLLYIVSVNWVDSHRRVAEDVTGGSCWINSSHFADDLVLLVSSQQGLRHALAQFFSACCQAAMKLAVTKPRYYVAPETQGSVYAARERQYTTSGGNVQAPWGGIHEWRKTEQGD